MTIKHFALSALTGTIALTAVADVDWMILPKYTSTGLMMIHGTRDISPKSKVPRVYPGMRLDTPEQNKLAKYKYLRIGSSKGNFCFCGMNEKGLGVIFTGGTPTSDKNPPPSPDVLPPNAATVAMLRSCATAQQAVDLMRDAFSKKLLSGSAIFLVADPNRAFVIESSPEHFASWELPHAFCAYSNSWKLPGMADGALPDAYRATNHYQREWMARERLKHAFDAKKVISVADSLAVSRTTVEEANGEAFAKQRGKAVLAKDIAPFTKRSVDSYLFELDSEFPAELSCVYAALGPARHTVYLPIPLGAADKLPKEIFMKEWVDNAYRLRDAADPAAPVRPELLEFENKLHRDYAKTRAKVRSLMRQDKFAEARKLLHATLDRQAKETFEFLNNLK